MRTMPMLAKKPRKRLPRGLIAGCAALLLAISSMPAQASIISIAGPGDYGETIEKGEAVAISFELTQTFTDVSISAPINLFAATGGLWLQKNTIGEDASYDDAIVAALIDSSNPLPFPTGLTLDPGLYSLIVSIESGGWATWSGSLAPSVTVGPGAAPGLDFAAADTIAFVPKSEFDVLFAPGTLHYRVDGNMVPEPASIAIFGMLFGLGTGLAAIRRRSSPTTRDEP